MFMSSPIMSSSLIVSHLYLILLLLIQLVYLDYIEDSTFLPEARQLPADHPLIAQSWHYMEQSSSHLIDLLESVHFLPTVILSFPYSCYLNQSW